MNDFLSVGRFGERKAIHSSERPSARILSLPPGAFILLGILGRRPSEPISRRSVGRGANSQLTLTFYSHFSNRSLDTACRDRRRRTKNKAKVTLGPLPSSLPPSFLYSRDKTE